MQMSNFKLKIKNHARGAGEIFAGRQMKQRSESKKILTATSAQLAIFLCFLLFAPRANAEELKTGVYPPLIKINATPPANVKTDIIVQNQTDHNITYYISLMPFKDSPKKNGEPFFDPALTNSYSDFFTRVKITDAGNEISEVELAPHQKKKLRLEITLSKENNARDYYFSVVFLSKNDLETPKTSSTEIRSGVGTNVLLSVGPKDGTDGTINAFKTKKFINSGPVTFEMEVKNSSNSFIEPECTIVIENMFGQKVGQVVIAPVNILSYSERESFAVWN